MLTAGVGLVFLTLCANVACLLLARFVARRRQFRVCSAIGASRGRLLAQAFVEAATLAAAGGVGGIFLAHGLVAFAAATLPEAFLAQTLHPMEIDGRALVMATALACASTLLVGLLPAWTATRDLRAPSLADMGRAGTETSGARLLTRTLLVLEVTLACALLASAGVLGRSFVNLMKMDRGFDPRGLMTVAVQFGVPRSGRPTVAASVEDAIRSVPGVEQLVWSRGAPLTPWQIDFNDYLPDTPGSQPVFLELEDFFVGPDFFSVYGIQLLEGRQFAPGEDEHHVIVGERASKRLWPNVDPVGRAFTGGGERFEVIGVAKEPRRPLLGSDARHDFPTLYRPAGDNPYGTLTIKCPANCPSEGVIRQRLLPLGPAVAYVHVQHLETTYRQDLAQPRATAIVGGIFAVVALVTAAGGLFSVLLYGVGRRRREFGIRTALGSPAAAIGWLAVRDGAAVMAIGIVCGASSAWLASRWLAALIYGVTTADPMTWSAVIGALALAGLLACWWPARSAMHVNPVELLREE